MATGTAAVSLPSLTATGALSVEPHASLTLPALTATGAGSAGASITAELSLPKLVLQGLGGNGASVSLPALASSGQVLSQSLITGDVRLPRLEATGAFDNNVVGSAAVALPAIVSTGSAMSGRAASVAATLPRLRTNGVAVSGTLATGALTLPEATVAASLIAENLVTANMALPALYTTAYGKATVVYTFSGWSMNVENVRTSEYDAYDFLAVGVVNGKLVGIAADGVHELTGGTDNTLAISADVMFGLDSFRTEDLKRLRAVYLGYQADSAGDLVVQVSIDGGAAPREYPVAHVSSDDGIKRGRATPGKGLKSRYWQYGVKNVAGADFAIDDMSMYVQQHNRKVQ